MMCRSAAPTLAFTTWPLTRRRLRAYPSPQARSRPPLSQRSVAPRRADLLNPCEVSGIVKKQIAASSMVAAT